MRQWILILTLWVFPITVQAGCLGHARPTQTLQVHIVPQLSPSVVYGQWAPLLDRIGQQTQLCFELLVTATIPAFEKALMAGQPDLAFANPYHAVLARQRQGYLPLVRDSKELLSGLLVVRTDASIRNLRDLAGKEVAFPAPNAFAASLVIRANLARLGIAIKPVYLNNHANVYRAVALGDIAAGGGVNNTLEREEANLRKSLKVLYETPGYAPHPLLAHPRISSKVREEIITAFLDLPRQIGGKTLLDAVQMPQPVRANYTRDYGPLEDLDLTPFVVLDEP